MRKIDIKALQANPLAGDESKSNQILREAFTTIDSINTFNTTVTFGSPGRVNAMYVMRGFLLLYDIVHAGDVGHVERKFYLKLRGLWQAIMTTKSRSALIGCETVLSYFSSFKKQKKNHPKPALCQTVFTLFDSICHVFNDNLDKINGRYSLGDLWKQVPKPRADIGRFIYWAISPDEFQNNLNFKKFQSSLKYLAAAGDDDDTESEYESDEKASKRKSGQSKKKKKKHRSEKKRKRDDQSTSVKKPKSSKKLKLADKLKPVDKPNSMNKVCRLAMEGDQAALEKLTLHQIAELPFSSMRLDHAIHAGTRVIERAFLALSNLGIRYP